MKFIMNEWSDTNCLNIMKDYRKKMSKTNSFVLSINQGNNIDLIKWWCKPLTRRIDHVKNGRKCNTKELVNILPIM